MDTVVWDSGFDLAPEFLYERIKPERRGRERVL